MDPEHYPCNEDHFEVSDEPPSDEQLNVWVNDTSYNYTCEKRVGEACIKVFGLGEREQEEKEKGYNFCFQVHLLDEDRGANRIQHQSTVH